MTYGESLVYLSDLQQISIKMKCFNIQQSLWGQFHFYEFMTYGLNFQFLFTIFPAPLCWHETRQGANLAHLQHTDHPYAWPLCQCSGPGEEGFRAWKLTAVPPVVKGQLLQCCFTAILVLGGGTSLFLPLFSTKGNTSPQSHAVFSRVPACG